MNPMTLVDNNPFPTNPSSTLSDPSTILAEYAKLRWQLIALETQRRQLEQVVIPVALNQIQAASDARHEVWRDEGCQIILQFRPTQPKATDHPELESLAELIELEAEKAKQIHQEAIAALTTQIQALQSQLEHLSLTDTGRDLQAQYQALATELAELRPVLVFRAQKS
jgi:hypothetical protein